MRLFASSTHNYNTRGTAAQYPKPKLLGYPCGRRPRSCEPNGNQQNEHWQSWREHCIAWRRWIERVADHENGVLEAVQERCRDQSVRSFSAHAGVHYPRLTEVPAGRRRPSRAMLAKLEAALTQAADWAAAYGLHPPKEAAG